MNKISVLNCYLYQVVALMRDEKVVNVYGHTWPPFTVLMELLEEEAEVADETSFRKAVFQQFQENRMDLLYGTLGPAVEKFISKQDNYLTQYVSLFPDDLVVQ